MSLLTTGQMVRRNVTGTIDARFVKTVCSWWMDPNSELSKLVHNHEFDKETVLAELSDAMKEDDNSQFDYDCLSHAYRWIMENIND